ncbi:MAG: hypothetical protein ACK55I_23980, partial [bacterium]
MRSGPRTACRTRPRHRCVRLRSGHRQSAQERDPPDRHPLRHQHVAVGQPDGVVRMHELTGDELLARRSAQRARMPVAQL